MMRKRLKAGRHGYHRGEIGKQPERVTAPLNAYQISKRGNALRVMAEAVRWAKRGARVNTISPGIIVIPLAKDKLSGRAAQDTGG
jgi:NAD(P)-dependent dehydrogenase (short-subunit alcohol dehydrogenase family)